MYLLRNCTQNILIIRWMKSLESSRTCGCRTRHDTAFYKIPTRVDTLLLLVSGFPEMRPRTATFFLRCRHSGCTRTFGCTSNVPFPPNRALMVEKLHRSGIRRCGNVLGTYEVLPIYCHNLCKTSDVSRSFLEEVYSATSPVCHFKRNTKTVVILLDKDRLLPCCGFTVSVTLTVTNRPTKLAGSTTLTLKVDTLHVFFNLLKPRGYFTYHHV